MWTWAWILVRLYPAIACWLVQGGLAPKVSFDRHLVTRNPNEDRKWRWLTRVRLNTPLFLWHWHVSKRLNDTNAASVQFDQSHHHASAGASIPFHYVEMPCLYLHLNSTRWREFRSDIVMEGVSGMPVCSLSIYPSIRRHTFAPARPPTTGCP